MKFHKKKTIQNSLTLPTVMHKRLIIPKIMKKIGTLLSEAMHHISWAHVYKYVDEHSYSKRFRKHCPSFVLSGLYTACSNHSGLNMLLCK